MKKDETVPRKMRTRFFTGKGDRGESEIAGKKVSKSSLSVELLGGLDELNSWLGLCSTAIKLKKGGLDVKSAVRRMQEALFIIQAEVAGRSFGYEKYPRISGRNVSDLEKLIKKIDSAVPKIEKFIIVGGSELSARLDFGRTLARLAERAAKRANEESGFSRHLLQYLNRLSSALFALARYANFKQGIKEQHPSYGKVKR